MTNIIHIRSSNFYGGPERQLHFHSRKAIGGDFKITISSFSENNNTPEFLDVIARDNIKTHTFDVKSAYDFSAIKQVRDFLIEKNIDIICTHDYRSHVIGWLSSRKTKVKWVAFSRGWTRDNIKVRFYHCLDKFIVRFADHIVAVSDSQKKKLEKLLISKNKITTVHNAIDPSAFDSISKVDLRELFKLPGNSIIFLSGGRFSSEKGQIDLVKAARTALKENSDLYFILFGDGPDLNLIREIIKNEKLENNILCPGFEKNLIGCLRGADFLINPSHSEGLPNIILEAMAMRIPCIATDVGGVGEIITDSQNGFLVPSKSPDEMAEVILKLAGEKELSKDITENAYNTIIDRFSFRSQFEKLNLLYNKILI